MPGLLNSLQSRPSSPTTVTRYNSARDFLSATLPILCQRERSSGIVFAHALKRLVSDGGRKFSSEADLRDWLRSPIPSHPSIAETNSFWLALWSHHGPGRQPSLDLVLSCLDWTLGDYPIFLWTPNRPETIEHAWLAPRITKLAQHLMTCVPPERVFSVFGMTNLVNTFASYWTSLTTFQIEEEPLYAAYLSHCTASTFIKAGARVSPDHHIRLATMEDIGSVAQLCKEFADDSVYFPLTLDRGRIEAQELIQKGQVWVYNISGECSTICAVTRTTFNVATITKVYTTPKFRKLGCAEQLVRHVTHKLLFEDNKCCVSLYVGRSNHAQRVYDRVGFIGLCGKAAPEDVEDSLELGFVGSVRGHW